MSHRLFLLFSTIFLLHLQLFAGNDSTRTWLLKGYLNDMQMVQFMKIDDPWKADNEIHNRLDFTWNPGTIFGLGIGMRNRFIFGQSLTENPQYRNTLGDDNGWADLTWKIADDTSYALVSQLDRAFVTISGKKFQATVGRQRVNWGQAVVWNPNDIFNAYSYYDIDYPERPGSDAIRLQYYLTATSVAELVSKWNHEGKITLAGMGRFNTGGYDIQFLAGLVDDQDWVAGAGWSGNLAGAAFRGEINYYRSKKNFADTTGILLATVGADYTFSNSLYLTFQLFYNQLPKDYLPTDLVSIYQAPTSPKTLSFAEWNLFLSGTYPITPLLEATLAGIWFPDLRGYYIGPSINYSLRENVDISLFGQYFDGRFSIPGFQPGTYYYFSSFLGAVRIKWCF